MSEKHLHIISFSIPYPPNYGGVIDVFYKIKALHKQNIKIHLHCFKYDRDESAELEKYCYLVNYYYRKTGFFLEFSKKPYIVAGRKSDELLNNLLNDDYPILFEGLHSCYLLDNKLLKNRIKIYRESNIEHHYYYNLFKAEKNIFNKIFFLSESIKLKFYQKVLKNASFMFAVSRKDTEYLQKHFKNNNINYLPSFHANDELDILPGKNNYALYHGKLSVAENYNAVIYLIKKVFNNTDIPLVVAGLDPPKHLINLINKHKNILLVKNPDDAEMFNLIKNAQINILITFQATGLKLKLLNTLFNGRHCIVNDKMVTGTGLDKLCVIANTPEELKNSLKKYIDKKINEDELEKRKKILSENYSNKKNAGILLESIFDIKRG